ncbi:hypothetical protein [Streptomyces sp. NBC_00425]|uniref:hypothetical protein n=1 Tax=Streptomyces sp. NBC_00425 TaxID=2975740 RepID=UPI002E233B21
MFSYECGNCNLRSEPYVLRNGAERRGQRHRDEKHDGMHPLNEAILSASGRMPQAGEWKVFAIVAALMLAGLISKML